MYDVPIIFQLDESGVLKKNVTAFYVIYPDVFKDAYHNVEHVMKKIEQESAKKKIASGLS